MEPSVAEAEERARHLLALTARLTDRLAEETRAFEAHRPQTVAVTAEETGRLANLYRHEVARIRETPALIGAAPEPTRRKLIAATEAFNAVLARHGRAVTAARTVTEGLVQAVAQEIAARRQSIAGYGPGASRMTAGGSAITLNRRA